MSVYSESNFNSKHYDMARPNYPPAFYDTLIDYHDKHAIDKSRNLAVDIGCGSGFVAFCLMKYFKNVIGTDISATMINQCLNDARTQRANGKIKFIQSPAEQNPPEIQENSVDVITGAECCHWVDHPKFFRESYRVLKPGGTLAYWFYSDPVFIGFPKANEIYTNYTYNSSMEANKEDTFERWMGPYWQQPGRGYLRTLLKEIDVPSELFDNVVRHEYTPHPLHSDASQTTLFISTKATLKDVYQYVSSWSAYHTWMAEHGDKYNIAEAFVNELKQELGWTDETEFELCWPTVYTFATKKDT